MDDGYIYLWRKINDNPILSRNNNALVMFVKILTNADWKTGCFVTGRFKLADLCNLTPSNTYKTLKRLEMGKMVTLESNNKFTKINILNWTTYQNKTNTKSNNKVTTKGQQSSTIQELISNNKPLSDFETSIQEFRKMRTAIKKPVTDFAMKQVLMKLEKLYPDDEHSKTLCLNQSIENSWQGVFPLKEQLTAKGARY